MLIHLFPFIYTTINIFFLSDMTIKYSDFWIVTLVEVLYLIQTYVWTSETGVAVYYFLTWEEDDLMSKWFVIIAFIAGNLTHISNAYISE